MAFEYVQGWKHHNLPEKPVPVLGHPHSEKVFPGVQTEPFAFHFVLTVSLKIVQCGGSALLWVISKVSF